ATDQTMLPSSISGGVGIALPLPRSQRRTPCHEPRASDRPSAEKATELAMSEGASARRPPCLLARSQTRTVSWVAPAASERPSGETATVSTGAEELWKGCTKLPVATSQTPTVDARNRPSGE